MAHTYHFRLRYGMYNILYRKRFVNSINGRRVRSRLFTYIGAIVAVDITSTPTLVRTNNKFILFLIFVINWILFLKIFTSLGILHLHVYTFSPGRTRRVLSINYLFFTTEDTEITEVGKVQQLIMAYYYILVWVYDICFAGRSTFAKMNFHNLNCW